MPAIESDVDLYIYRHSKTEFGFKSSSYTPNSFLLDTFIFMEYCEAFSLDARSNKVILRCGFKLDWIDKPWVIGDIIESIV